MRNLLILGGGGFGQTVQETAMHTAFYEKIAFLDDALKNAIGTCEEYLKFKHEYPYAYPAFGNNILRMEWLNKLKNAGFIVPKIIHPKAFVSNNAIVGEGSIVLANACVNGDVMINTGCIINFGAIIDHNSIIESGVHVGLGAIVKAGNVIQAHSTIHAGEIIQRKGY